MSVCLVVQQKERCFMCSDGAITSNINGVNIRISNKGEKMFTHKNASIFCSGNVKICNKIIKRIKDTEELSIEAIRTIAKDEYYGESFLEIFVACNKLDDIFTYQISSYNNFEVIERNCLSGQTHILSLGYNSDRNFAILKELIMKGGNISDIFKSVFENISCPEVGGDISLNIVDKFGAKRIKRFEIKEDVEIKKISDIRDTYFIIGKQIIGEIILGHKLYITSENGEFYIGDMDDLNKGFGLSIKDANDVQRVFLGTELENGVRKARLRLYGKDGQGLVLSEDGILNTSQQFIIENLSKGYDLNIPFIVDKGVASLSKVQLTLLFDKYRGYTRGSSAGGGTTATSEGGGDFDISSDSGEGGTYNYSATTSSDNRVMNGVDPSKTYAGWTGDPRESEDNPISATKHIHTVYSNPHYHDVKINISIPSHRHNFRVTKTAHKHNVILKDHEHPEVHGIYVEESSGVENAKVYVNGVLVSQNINSTSAIVDITKYLKLNSVNYIRISNEKNARVSVNIFEKKFITW